MISQNHSFASVRRYYYYFEGCLDAPGYEVKATLGYDSRLGSCTGGTVDNSVDKTVLF